LHARKGYTPAFFITEKGARTMSRREERVNTPVEHDERDDKRAEAAKGDETPEPRSTTITQTIVSDEYRRQPYFI
jgi:hypothetical protein